jgi:hypothetical protein
VVLTDVTQNAKIYCHDLQVVVLKFPQKLGFSPKRFEMWLKPMLLYFICPGRKRRGYKLTCFA